MDLINQLDAIYKPKSVAVIGASPTAGKIGYDVVYNLIHAGFAGPIYPVNPKADQILGLSVYKQIGDISPPPDLAVVIIPAKAVPGAIDQCGIAGVKAAVVITGGFAEAGQDGAKLQEELADTACRYGIRVVGPNCQGVNNPHHNLCASWPLLTMKGRMAFISQSGTVGAALMDWASEEHLGVSVFVSLGNRADVDEADCIRYFNQDPHTRVIALYIEGVKRPVDFQNALAAATKPVVILKSGRTPRGRIAAESHTKSLAGVDAVYDAIFKKYNVHRADTIEELYDYAKALAHMSKPPGRRLLNITSSGGAAIIAIDQAEKLGFETPTPSTALKERLRAILPAHCAVDNPIDLTGDVIGDPTLYTKVIDAARADYDTMVIIFGDPISGASKIVTPDASELVIFLGGADVEREERLLIHERGIPVFPAPERGLKALHQFFRFDSRPISPSLPHASTSGLHLLPAGESLALLDKAGIPAVAALLATSPEEAVALARDVAAPVALKIASLDIAHKSDVGGVRLNLSTDEEVHTAYREIMAGAASHAPNARLEGVTVSPMARPGGMEVIVGVFTDPQYGPTLMFGLGGIFTEIYKDVQFCLLPASEEELRQTIRSVTGYPLLAGVRGQPPRDQAALVEVMKGVSRLAVGNPDLDQIDLNPVLVYEQGVSVVDVRIFRRSM
ncbi:MAG: acetate--CoA ligase family protein [Deltaproteobacteria bacterium]|nr:acetate--CoA ligase family protein [Deltaproteobacteria bacterium]